MRQASKAKRSTAAFASTARTAESVERVNETEFELRAQNGVPVRGIEAQFAEFFNATEGIGRVA